MEAAVVRQFLDFFQDFINLCQSESWLNLNTSQEEIRNAFLISQHIEKCLNKLQNNSLLDEFLSSLNNKNDLSSALFKSYFTDPPKYILKKILQSNVGINQVDVSFSLFLYIFSEAKLEECLSDIMLETASQEVLTKNLTVEFSKEKIAKFKSLILLSELSSCDNPEKVIEDILSSYEKDMIEMLVICLLNNDFKYVNARKNIVSVFLNIMSRRSVDNKKIWSILLSLPEEDLRNLCLVHPDLFRATSRALLDCGRLISENMSSDYFYISLTYYELLSVLQKLFKNDDLKTEFLEIIVKNNSDLEFWNNALKS